MVFSVPPCKILMDFKEQVYEKDIFFTNVVSFNVVGFGLFK